MMDIDAFFLGYKPSLLYNPNYEYAIYNPEQMKKLKNYPYLEVIVHKQKQRIYFQTEEDKNSFSQRIEGLTHDSLPFHHKLGLVMGFPPKAVQFYIQLMEDETLERQKVRMEYCGISCVGSIDDIIDNVVWFWRLNVPSDVHRITRLDYSFPKPSFTYWIDFEDMDSLLKAEKEILLLIERRKRGHQKNQCPDSQNS